MPNQDQSFYQELTDAMFAATGKGVAINKAIVDAAYAAHNAKLLSLLEKLKKQERLWHYIDKDGLHDIKKIIPTEAIDQAITKVKEGMK